MRYFCTLFDINYLPNFLALYHSLAKEDCNFKIYAFCMDDKSYNFLINYPKSSNFEIKCIELSTLTSFYPVLLKIKKERSIVEFYFTCSSFITMFVIQNETFIEHITYLDADLYFFKSPELIFKELGDASIGIIPHNFYGSGKKYLKYGKYNVGWVTFKNDEQGLKCLESWKDKCEDWCYDYFDEANQRFGDQKYLDKWPIEFKNVKVIEHKGANLAPWNVGQYYIHSNNNELFVDEYPIIFYHFASFKKINKGLYTTNLSMYLSRPTRILKDKIYHIYLEEVSKYSALLYMDFHNEELLKKDRKAIKQSIIQKINKYFAKLLRWYFNDKIYYSSK